MNHPLRTAAMIAAGCSLFAAGFFYREYAGSNAEAASRSAGQRYTCPMHPHYVSDKPGDAPCCGMRLVQVGTTAPAIPNSIKLSDVQQQIGGVRTAMVVESALQDRVHTTGRVVPDEARVYNVVANTEGWIRKVHPEAITGSLLTKGQPLVAIYSRELLQVQQTFLYTLRGLASMKPDSGEQVIGQVRTAHQESRVQLENGGFTPAQIEALKQSGTPAVETEFLAPASGLIVSRSVSPGQRIERGAELFRIADLSHVWVQADLFERETRLLKPGAKVQVRHAALGFTAEARVGGVLPQFDPQTRTMKLRLEVNNPGFTLRPDMFVDVEFDAHQPRAVVVASDAVLDTGNRKTVFVDRGEGLFEQREVSTGTRAGGQVVITAGLKAGDRIVTSGAFLLDSESKMHHATVRVTEPPTGEVDPICGMRVQPSRAKYKLERNGKVTYFCSEQCLRSYR